MNEVSCYANQDMAQRAIQYIKAGNSIGGLPKQYMERVLVCGKCPLSTISYVDAKNAFRKSIDEMVGKMKRIDFWGTDCEP